MWITNLNHQRLRARQVHRKLAELLQAMHELFDLIPSLPGKMTPLSADQLAQPLTSHPIPIAIQVAVSLPQQLLRPGKGADLLAGGLGPAWQGSLRA